jgi:predicted alpha/beta-fold hydrolase
MSFQAGPLKHQKMTTVFAATATVAAATTAFMTFKRSYKPQIKAKPTVWNESIRKLCPHLAEGYSMPFFLNNGHVETIFAAFFRSNPHLTYDREILTMPDGGSVALDAEVSEQQLPEDAPVLILLPGLTGGSGDTYVQHAVLHAKEAGIRAIVFNSRATSGSPVTTAQFYSASFTGDMRCVVAHVGAKYPSSRIFAAGWSLGANILTKYLGEEGDQCAVEAAVAMCNPFDLTVSDENFKRGFNRIYDWNLAKSLGRIYKNHHSLFVQAAAEGLKAYEPDRALKAKTIREFDDSITRISFGWGSVDEYYAGSSSSSSVPDVKVPLLVIQAEDDPIAPVHAIPFDKLQENDYCMLVLTPTGGHLGWCRSPDILGAPWTDMALLQYFRACIKLLEGAPIKRRDEDPIKNTRQVVVQE